MRQAGTGERCHQHVAVAAVGGDAAVEQGLVVEGPEGCVLGDGRGRDEEVLGQALDRLDELRRQHEPAQAPAGHAEILGEAVDQDRFRCRGERRPGPVLVGDAVVDLVHDEADGPLAAEGGQGRKILLAEHGAGRVGGARQHEAVQRPVDGRELPDGGLEPGRGVDRDRHHLDVERSQDVAVGRIARHRHGDPVAGIEGGEEAQDEGARGAGRDRDAGGIDLLPVPLAIVAGDAAPQGRQAQGLGIAEPGLAQRRLGGRQRRRRSTAAGLAHLEVEDIRPLRRALVRGLEHLHDDERRDQPATRRPLAHLLPIRPGTAGPGLSGWRVQGSTHG